MMGIERFTNFSGAIIKDTGGKYVLHCEYEKISALNDNLIAVLEDILVHEHIKVPNNPPSRVWQIADKVLRELK